MQGNQSSQSHKMGSGTKAVLWGGGIIATIVAVLPILGLVIYVSIFLVTAGIYQVTGQDYESNIQRGVTKAIAKFTPQDSWTEISKTEVQKRSACTPDDRANYKTDCEWFRGVWDTNAPYNENSIFDIAKSFGKTDAVNNKSNKEIKDSCVRASPESPLVPCRVQTYISSADNNSYIFTVTLTDQGPGTDVIATVTYAR